MSFILCSIVLYSKAGDKRVLPFAKDGLNIITGKSKTGKSAIIDIIEFCLGRDDFNVAEGIIRQKVAWFGVHLEQGEDNIFIARSNPGPGASKGGDIYVTRQFDAHYPDIDELSKTFTRDALVAFLTKFCGIEENEHRPVTGTRMPLSATIKHALWFCFQKQNTIASQDQLFHRMNEQWLPQALKDVFPYFMGAVDEEHFDILGQLDVLERRRRELEKEIKATDRLKAQSRTRFSELLAQGKTVGLVPSSTSAADTDAEAVLLNVAERLPEDPELLPDFGTAIEELRNETGKVRDRLNALNQERRAAYKFLSDRSQYSEEKLEQRYRLKSVGLFKQKAQQAVCPLCANNLENQVVSREEVLEALDQSNRGLRSVFQGDPHIQEHIRSLNKKIEETTSELRGVQRRLQAAIKENDAARRHQNSTIAVATFIGRVQEYISTQSKPEDNSLLLAELHSLNVTIDSLKSKVNDDDWMTKFESFLLTVGKKMTDFAKELELEHDGSSLRLDVKKLTVIADTLTGAIPLARMGSGENWVAYHIISHLALHWWFRLKARPVPSFLVFDQPTQAFYPPDGAGSIDEIEGDADRRAVLSFFKLMSSACAEVKSPFQLIVLDHAHLKEEWFESAIVEEWRGENALVPRSW